MSKPTLIILASIFLVVGIVRYYIWGGVTTFCPIKHHLSDMSACYVLDESNGTTLIQHANLDNGVAYIEIRKQGHSTLYELPNGIEQFAPQGYQAKLSESPGVIIIDGVKVKMQKAKQKTRMVSKHLTIHSTRSDFVTCVPQSPC